MSPDVIRPRHHNRNMKTKGAKKRKHTKHKTKSAEEVEDIGDNEDLTIDRYILPDNDDRDQRQDIVGDDINSGKLSEHPLHVNFPRLRWSEDYIEKASELGLTVRKGKFTKEEEKILTSNWHQFCDDFPIDNPYHYLGYFNYSKYRDDNERTTAHQIIKYSEMYLRLAKGLPERPIIKIYQKARRMFSGLKRSVDLTEKDRKRILELHIEGHKKSDIGLQTFTEIKTVAEVIRHQINPTGRELKKNKWSEEDNQRLIKVIRRLMKTKKIPNYEDIPWSDVAILMKDRNDYQCKTHFHSVQFFRTYDPESAIGLKKWNKVDTQKIVYYIWKNQFKSESEIDWDFLKEKFPHILFRSIVRHWYLLKMAVPNHYDMSFPDLVDFLYKQHIDRVLLDIEELDNFCKLSED